MRKYTWKKFVVFFVHREGPAQQNPGRMLGGRSENLLRNNRRGVWKEIASPENNCVDTGGNFDILALY